jgi:oligopeptide transport system substrate-binding protein
MSILKSINKPLCAALCLCLFAAGCGRHETPVEIGIRDGVLHLGNLSEPKDLDPHIVTGLSAYNVIAALHEGLVTENPSDLRPVPGVAESWDISPDRTVYTFHLRKNAKWSNGDSVTANDFVFSYRRILSPNLGSPYAYMLHLLKNGRAYNLGELDDFSLVGVKAPDPLTLELTLEQPTPSFLAQLSHWSWFPVHPGSRHKDSQTGLLCQARKHGKNSHPPAHYDQTRF